MTAQRNVSLPSARAGLSDLGIAADLFDKLKAGFRRAARTDGFLQVERRTPKAFGATARTRATRPPLQRSINAS